MPKTTIEIDGETKTVPSLLSCRVALAMVGFFGCIVLYMMRVNMGVAVVCMTYDVIENSTTPENETQSYLAGLTHNAGASYFGDIFGYSEDEECPGDDTEAEDETGEFDWDRQLRGFINSSFFWGYVATQIIGGFLANRFGPKWVLFGGMILQVGGTVLTPPAARISPYALIVIRILEGIGAGMYFPCYMALWSEWAPPEERSRLVACVYSGISWGSVFSFALSGLICADIGWEWIFYIYGIAGFLWMVVWVFMTFNSPAEHPRIKQAELKYIEQSIGHKEVEDVPVPWFKIFTSMPVISIVIADFCLAWGQYTSLTTLPQYMEDVLKVDIKQNGLYNSLPHVVKFATTLLFAQLADLLIAKRILNLTWTRKLMQSLGFVLPAGFAIGISFLGCNDIGLVITFLCLFEGFIGASRSGLLPNMVDLAPRFASIVCGFSNTGANIPGIIAPIVVGAITTDGTREQWRVVFLMSAAFFLFGWIQYMIFASAEVQDWAKTEDELALEKSGIEYVVPVVNEFDKDNGQLEKCTDNEASDKNIISTNTPDDNIFMNGKVNEAYTTDEFDKVNGPLEKCTDNEVNEKNEISKNISDDNIFVNGKVNEAYETDETDQNVVTSL